MFASYGSRQDLLRWPSLVDPAPKGVFIQAKFFGPLSDCHGAPVKGEPPRRSAVACLRLPVGAPDYVCGSVAPVVVHAFKGMLEARPSADISNEILEFPPSRADRNAAAPVDTIPSRLRVETPLKHHLPQVIFARGPQAVLDESASARRGGSAVQVSDLDGLHGPTQASASHIGHVFLRPTERSYDVPSADASAYLNHSPHPITFGDVWR